MAMPNATTKQLLFADSIERTLAIELGEARAASVVAKRTADLAKRGYDISTSFGASVLIDALKIERDSILGGNVASDRPATYAQHEVIALLRDRLARELGNDEALARAVWWGMVLPSIPDLAESLTQTQAREAIRMLERGIQDVETIAEHCDEILAAGRAFRDSRKQRTDA
jgi:hypothetical protein